MLTQLYAARADPAFNLTTWQVSDLEQKDSGSIAVLVLLHGPYFHTVLWKDGH